MHSNDKGAVLITGASGFLGTYIAEAYKQLRNPLLGIDYNPPREGIKWTRFIMGPCESASLKTLLTEFNVATVFHLAGGASVPASVQLPFHDFSTSVPGTVKLLSEVVQHSPNVHLIFVSSAAVYGNPVCLPISEEAAVAPISPYGIHKAMSELALREYARVYDLKISILRVFSVFGPGLRKQLFWDLSQLAHKAHAKGERTIVLQGAGTESRDFIFAKDVAKAALHIAHRVASSGFEIFNIGSGRETEIQDAASQLITHLNLNIDLAFDGNVRPGVPRNWRADVTKLSESGFSPEVSFNEGIGLVATWLKNDYSSSS